MARMIQEKPVNRVKFFFSGNDEDVIKFLKVAAFEYIAAHLPQVEDDMHKELA